MCVDGVTIVFAGFAGDNTLEEAQVLMIGNCVMDTLTPLFKMHGVKEEEVKASTWYCLHIVGHWFSGFVRHRPFEHWDQLLLD